MACVSVPTAILGAGALSAGSSLVGAGVSSSAAQSAAAQQTQAAKIAANSQLNAAQIAENTTLTQFDQTQNNLSPYNQAGTGAIGNLFSAAGALGDPLTTPIPNAVANVNTKSPLAANPTFSPTMAQLQQTPGYQFTLGQGLESTQNSFAAQGLASSGAALKGAANYAEGLASTTYQNQFSNWLNQQQLALSNYSNQTANQLNQAEFGQNFNLNQNQQLYNMLGGIATTGQNAAANLGGLGIQATGQVNNALIGGTTAANQLLTSGAAAGAAGTVGSANALTSALSGIGNTGSNTGLLLALNNSGFFGNTNPQTVQGLSGPGTD